ncbi:MAG: membrane protease YdiL (CAAX protease family) [Roseivirga sp.]|jgi:membrane protease YdiL (CAAX protease family)
MKNRKHFIYIIGVSLGFALMLALALPLRSLIGQFLADEKVIRLVAGIIVRLSMFGVLIYLIKRLELTTFLGLKTRFRLDQLQVIIIPLIIIIMSILGDLTRYKNAGLSLLGLFLVSNPLIALVEELTFRAIVLPLILKIRSNKKRLLLVSVVMSSMIFGVLHFLNLFREPGNFSGITSQVIFATCISVYLGALFLRTRHIIFPVMIHFLINVAFGKSVLTPENNDVVTKVVGETTDWASLLLTLGLFGTIAMGGVFVIRLVKKVDVLESLSLKKGMI